MLLPSPAPSWTMTWWPAWTSAWTEAGIIPTRYSLSLTSLGMPISTLWFPRLDECGIRLAGLARAARLPGRRALHLNHSLEESTFGDDDPRRGDVPFEAPRGC